MILLNRRSSWHQSCVTSFSFVWIKLPWSLQNKPVWIYPYPSGQLHLHCVQTSDCPSNSETTLTNMRKYVTGMCHKLLYVTSTQMAFSIVVYITWWRHPMETFSALLAICAGNLPVPGEFPAQRPVTRSFNVFFDLRPNKRLGKQCWGWWFETPSSPLRRHCNDIC